MEFIKTTDDHDNEYYYRMVSLDGAWQIMVWPVVYGYRVRIGETADLWGVRVDTCAGNDLEALNDLYNLYLLAMARIDEPSELSVFLGLFNASVIKPYVKDELFTRALYVAAGIESTEQLRDNYLVEITSLSRLRSGVHKLLGVESWQTGSRPVN